MGFKVIEHKNEENRKMIVLIHGAYHGRGAGKKILFRIF